MQRMVTAPIPTHSPNDITRAQSRAEGWIASFDFDGSPTSTPPLSTIASTNESPSDSSTTTSILTGPFCCNHQYSITAITTSAGAISERYAYTAYGQPTILHASGTPLSSQTSTLNSRYSYTGREWDATLGLHHFRARWMSPSAGRFLGRDPIGYADGANPYEIFHSTALRRLDPSGYAPLDCSCHCWGGGSCGGREPLYPRYDIRFTLQIDSTDNPNLTGQAACNRACLDENERRGNQPNNCTATWKMTGTNDPPVGWHCSIPDCQFGCSIAAGSAFDLCLLRGGHPKACLYVFIAVKAACNSNCYRICDDSDSWIWLYIQPNPHIWTPEDGVFEIPIQ
jgi:RHS repeat-associated protein